MKNPQPTPWQIKQAKIRLAAKIRLTHKCLVKMALSYELKHDRIDVLSPQLVLPLFLHPKLN